MLFLEAKHILQGKHGCTWEGSPFHGTGVACVIQGVEPPSPGPVSCWFS